MCALWSVCEWGGVCECRGVCDWVVRVCVWGVANVTGRIKCRHNFELSNLYHVYSPLCCSLSLSLFPPFFNALTSSLSFPLSLYVSLCFSHSMRHRLFRNNTNNNNGRGFVCLPLDKWDADRVYLLSPPPLPSHPFLTLLSRRCKVSWYLFAPPSNPP